MDLVRVHPQFGLVDGNGVKALPSELVSCLIGAVCIFERTYLEIILVQI